VTSPDFGRLMRPVYAALKEEVAKTLRLGLEPRPESAPAP